MTDIAAPLRPDEVRAERIRLFVCEHAAVAPGKVALDSKLESDLGITGDDASDLMSTFFERFSVDPKGFRFLDHFEGEGWITQGWLVVAAMRLLSKKFDADWQEATNRESDITVRHLIDCATRGRWLPPQPLTQDGNSTIVPNALNAAIGKLAAILLATFFFAVGVVLPCVIAVAAISITVSRGEFWALITFLGAALFILIQFCAAWWWAREKTRALPNASSAHD